MIGIRRRYSMNVPGGTVVWIPNNATSQGQGSVTPQGGIPPQGQGSVTPQGGIPPQGGIRNNYNRHYKKFLNNIISNKRKSNTRKSSTRRNINNKRKN